MWRWIHRASLWWHRVQMEGLVCLDWWCTPTLHWDCSFPPCLMLWAVGMETYNRGLKYIEREKLAEGRDVEEGRREGRRRDKMSNNGVQGKKKKARHCQPGWMREENIKGNLSRGTGTILINRNHYSLLLHLWFSRLPSPSFLSSLLPPLPHLTDNQFHFVPRCSHRKEHHKEHQGASLCASTSVLVSLNIHRPIQQCERGHRRLM